MGQSTEERPAFEIRYQDGRPPILIYASGRISPADGVIINRIPYIVAEATARLRFVTDEMIQAACKAGYGVDTDKDSPLYKVMQRALQAVLK